tara:strand:- start:1230 stop:1376 length:147 start_codon:yes stop_codon:yes gene_type:complete
MSTFTDVNNTAIPKKPKYYPKTSFMYAQEAAAEAAKAKEEESSSEESE